MQHPFYYAREADRDRETSNSKAVIRNDSSIRSILSTCTFGVVPELMHFVHEHTKLILCKYAYESKRNSTYLHILTRRPQGHRERQRQRERERQRQKEGKMQADSETKHSNEH